MNVLEAQALTRSVQHFATSTVNSNALASEVDQASVNGWNQIIDRTLIEWGRNPDQFADDEAQPPTPSAIAAAAQIARAFRDRQAPAPTLAAPDGEGGVSFELRHANGTELLLIHPDSTVEMICFQNHCVTHRCSGRVG